ncbi:hypothetical protein FA15DRAFT_695228 [Coprinopsis marcescibilis]|uniref:Fungal-type protein kinase domain-containing protein n=1 Tax=Coprinopsis marcescibilis TaxID=230819 RepID=A0A5C3KRI9_COPMA|nr:hypothetical protein FA15DRAFT_695228 [Coprinopsis marcescibilis]
MDYLYIIPWPSTCQPSESSTLSVSNTTHPFVLSFYRSTMSVLEYPFPVAICDHATVDKVVATICSPPFIFEGLTHFMNRSDELEAASNYSAISEGTTCVSGPDIPKPEIASDIFAEEEEWNTDDEHVDMEPLSVGSTSMKSIFSAVQSHSGFLEQLMEHTSFMERHTDQHDCPCEFCQIEDGDPDMLFDDALDGTMGGYCLTEFEDIPDFINQLFPDQYLPVDVVHLTQRLVYHPEIYSLQTRRWKQYPVSREAIQHTKELHRFLNWIAAWILRMVQGLTHQVPPAHRAWHLQANVYDKHGLKLPEIAVVQPSDNTHWTAAHIKVVLPGKGESAACGACQLLSTQQSRHFYLCGQFNGDKVCILFYDDHRFARSQEFNAHQDPVQLVRLIAGFMFAPAELLGANSSLTRRVEETTDLSLNERTEVRTFIGGDTTGVKFEALRWLYSSPNYYGRGTRVIHARDARGMELVIKEIWEPFASAPTEPDIETEILWKIKGIAGVPQLHAERILKTSEDWGKANLKITDLKPKHKSSRPFHELCLRQVVLIPYAEPLLAYNSIPELISVLIDALYAHNDLLLSKECRILHRNVSVSSIMMFDPTKYGSKLPLQHNGIRNRCLEPWRAGMLTSFSHAIQLNIGYRGATDLNFLHGDYACLAVEVLFRGPRSSHQKRHDLESFFWVLICICIGHVDPAYPRLGGTRNSDRLLKKLSLLPEDRKDSSKVGIRKWTRVGNEHTFKTKLLPHFLPQFHGLRDLACRLRSLFFGDHKDIHAFLASRKGVQHREVIACFEDAATLLQAQ